MIILFEIGDIRADYSASLLKLAIGHRVINGTPLGFGEGDTKVRVKNVMNYKKPVVGVLIGVGLIALICMILLGTNGKWNGLVPVSDGGQESESSSDEENLADVGQENSTKSVLYSDVKECFYQFHTTDAGNTWELDTDAWSFGMQSLYV